MTELSPVEAENPIGGFGKTVSHLVIGFKTAKGTKQLKLDPSIYESIQVNIFSRLLPKQHTYFYVCHIDGMATVFPTMTGNRTHVSSVAPLRGPFT